MLRVRSENRTIAIIEKCTRGPWCGGSPPRGVGANVVDPVYGEMRLLRVKPGLDADAEGHRSGRQREVGAQ